MEEVPEPPTRTRSTVKGKQVSHETADPTSDKELSLNKAEEVSGAAHIAAKGTDKDAYSELPVSRWFPFSEDGRHLV